ncbi:glycosyltransferase family 4 protein [Oceanidesulfovibrio marinus]|uniref:Glycosyltransferase family 4 protein n=1 Tax=Oceanidesulfovibrio marinus TaxID=370038 RepID=A0ABX6NJA2_9BACT|nr:glycosyltransferase family 4 protein [Oceanidesulfovibrio marinus]QJT09807.1 glycosyltransferase family 4 protein [Oceanidesulfovibrio marinus]
MKVLFNTYPVAFDCPGGGEVQLMECKAALERRGIEVLLYDPWQPQFDQADVVHFFSVQGGSIPFCRHVKNRGLPLAISPILWLGENKYDYALKEIGALLELCDVVLPNSRAEGKLLANWYKLPESKFAPVVNGVDDRFFAKGDPLIFCERFGIETPFLLNIANIEPRKNQKRLIQASRDLEMLVILAGRIRDEAYWKECQEYMHPGVRYIGPLEYASDLHRSAYAACKGFILATRLETPGLAALEAAAQGVPLCITSEGCAEEYFGEHPHYVDPQSVESIRAGLKAVCGMERSPELARLVKRRYTWDEAGRQLHEVYTRLV